MRMLWGWMAAAGVGFVALLAGCESYPFLPGHALGGGSDGVAVAGGVSVASDAFVERSLQQGTFLFGTAATTVTYDKDDLTRSPIMIDFNGDGRVDPVLGYGDRTAVVQILLSNVGGGFLSLTLDSKRDMKDLASVAVGDIDNDGYPDVVAAAREAVWYFRHPSSGETTDLRSWGNPDPTDDLRERIDGSVPDPNDPNQNLQAIISQAVGPGVNIDDYIITIEQTYTDVGIADLDLDGDNDIVATRKFKITMTPRPNRPVEPIEIVDGDLLAFVNPGFATDGHGWTKISVGRHERQQRLDRDGANTLVVYDLDGDGDFDLLSVARDDNNVQVAWFENPGPPLSANRAWTQWRIGSVRDAWSLDLADITGDGKPDVVATGSDAMELVLFVQPDDGPKRNYDWDRATLAKFQSFEPRDVKVLDLDGDGVLEIVVGGSDGALRWFERGADPRAEWSANVIANFDPPGDVGRLAWGDLDGDGDFDLIALIDPPEDPEQGRAVWVENRLSAVGLLPAP